MSSSLLDSGPLEALTPDEAGVLREWSMKYAVISEPQTDSATLSIFSSAADVIESEPEVDIPINDCEVQISREASFERCFTVTANGLKVFLRAANVQERNDWVDSIRHGTKPLPPPSMPPPSFLDEEEEGEDTNHSERLRACGYVYVWEEATQQWTDLVFLYLSAGFLHEFRAPFRLPTRTHDLTLNCAIRVRGTPPCIEMKLNEHDAILRFYGREEAETLQWLTSIKTRALEPPQRFIDLAVAAFDCFTVEQSLAKSFYIRTGTLNSLLAGATSTFPVVGTSEDANHHAQDFSCTLTSSFEDSASALARGSFHVLADDTLSLHMAYNKQGKYFMHVKFRNEHVLESPFPVVVHATLPSAPHSVVSGRGMLFAPTRKNRLGKFIVTLRDRYLNLCNTTVDAKRLEVQCFGPASLAQIKFVGEGGFEISYRVANVSSEVSLEVSYAGIPVAGSPFFPAFGEDEEEVDDRSGQQQQQQQQQPPVGDQTTQDLALARRVALRSEAMSSFLSSKIRKEWSNPLPPSSLGEGEGEESFPEHEQLEMMMQSAALRLHPSFVSSDTKEPAFLRSFGVELDNSKWEPEPLPAPWASIALVTAQAGRARRDLQACLDPLVQACKDELPTSAMLEPKAQWKRTLLDWPGAERASLPQIKQFKLDVSCSPLDHRQVICAMCDAILRIERDLDTRRKAKRQENGGLLAMDDGEDEDELAIPALPDKQGNHREQLRKRVQSLAIGAKPTLISAERPVREMQYAHLEAAAKPLDASVSMPQLEDSEDEEEGQFRLGDLVVVDGSKVGVVRYVGPALFAEGVWVGLELNTPEGKNNGSVNGRKYFACKANFGLFVRPDRLTSTAEPSLPLLMSAASNRHSRRADSVEEETFLEDDQDDDDGGDIWQSSNDHHFGEDDYEDDEDDYAQPPPSQQQQRHWDYDESEQGDEEEHVKPWNEHDEDDEEEDLFAPSPPSTPLPKQVVLALGSLSAFDARDVASAIKARVNSYGRLTREAFVSSVKHWEPMADTQQLVGLFQALGGGGGGEGKDQVDPVLLNPLLVCLCGTARSNPSAAFYLLDLNRSGLLERDEVERFARAVFTLSAGQASALAQAKQVAESALKRFSALGTSLSFEEFAMWIQHTPAMTGGKQVVAITTTNPARYDEDDWAQVERWLEEQVGVTVAFEKKAALEALRESNYRSLAVIAKLTPREVNHLSLSFDLRLRLVTQVRALAKARKQPTNRLTNAEHDHFAPSPLRHPLD